MKVSAQQPIQLELSPQLKKGSATNARHQAEVTFPDLDALHTSKTTKAEQPVIHSLGFIEDAPQQLQPGEVPLVKLLTLDWLTPMFTK